MPADAIIIRGAREHNLKNIHLELPRDRLIIFTGISGSGKSTLAFDTLYAEGQRRYVESLSAYARQFLGQMEKPDVDDIEGLSPAISIDQKTTSRNPRSTVGTVTEIYDYLRLLYARVGQPHCPECGQPIRQQGIDQMVEQVLGLPAGTRLQILSPVVRGRKGEYQELLDEIRREGYVRVRIDGEVRELTETLELDRNVRHEIDVVVDRLVLREGVRSRLADSMETALARSDGLVRIDVVDGEELLLSRHLACPDCRVSIEELAPRMFSFNSPYGACPACNGLGTELRADPDRIIPDPERSLAEGAVAPWNRGTYYPQLLESVADYLEIPVDRPFEELAPRSQRAILAGHDKERIPFSYRNRYGRTRHRKVWFEGVLANIERRYREAAESKRRTDLEEYMSQSPCPACGGGRLAPASLAVTVGGASIAQVCDRSITDALDFFTDLQLGGREAIIARQVLKEIRARLQFLTDVGLDYLTLSRTAGTLSGGEAQRIRLATQIGSGLVGVLYILDEPSIGLHQRDNRRLLATLKALRDLGNTLIVVEHDEETIREADHVVDLGPGAGARGGEVVAQGDVEDVIGTAESVTGQYLAGQKAIPVPGARREGSGWLTVRGARQHNLKEIDVGFPLGTLTCVTGVSGSGKSTLVTETLYRALARELYRSRENPGAHDGIDGVDQVGKAVEIDQSPIGRTPRSNPATYTNVFDDIRQLFAETPEAKARGYVRGRFSFNLKGGRCEACAGDGMITIEMHFLPDVYVPCEVCQGQRYNRETLEIRYKGKTIADVLAMSVEEALDFFRNHPPIKRRLQTLYDVGLGYLRLGQPSTTLSGGEAQRVKLASELSRRSNGDTVYVLDEPTTGLHIADVHRLLEVLHRLVDQGDTVIVIEHHLDVIKNADYLIDLGPEGGDEGGQVVVTGTPEQVVRVERSHTGRYLRKVLIPEVSSVTS